MRPCYPLHGARVRDRPELQRALEGPETISDLGAGVPNDAELEPTGGVPHRLGGASEVGGLDSRRRLTGLRHRRTCIRTERLSDRRSRQHQQREHPEQRAIRHAKHGDDGDHVAKGPRGSLAQSFRHLELCRSHREHHDRDADAHDREDPSDLFGWCVLALLDWYGGDQKRHACVEQAKHREACRDSRR